MQLWSLELLQLAFCCRLCISALVISPSLCSSCLSASVCVLCIDLNILVCMYDSGVACMMPLCSNHTSEVQNVIASWWKSSVGVYRYYCLVVYLVAPFFSIINAYCAGKPPYTLLHRHVMFPPCDVLAM